MAEPAADQSRTETNAPAFLQTVAAEWAMT
jgi:hypothetical protein